MKRLILLPLILLVFLALLVPVNASNSHTWYFRGETLTVNGQLGYAWNETNFDVLPSTLRNLTEIYTDALNWFNVSWGFRVYKVNGSNLTQELTSGTPTAIVTRTTAAQGYQVGTWSCVGTSFTIGLDSLLIVAYTRFGNMAWIPLASFTTRELSYVTLDAVTWNFTVYTQRTLDIGGGGDRDTYSCLVFGNTGYESQVNTVTFSDLDSWQYQSDFLNRGWFLDWLVAPYTFSFAGHFWDLWIMIPLAGIYLRCRNSTPLLVLFVIFGGIGGIFALMLSPFATAVIEGFCLFSLASILYKVWR